MKCDIGKPNLKLLDEFKFDAFQDNAGKKISVCYFVCMSGFWSSTSGFILAINEHQCQ
jgi:hypothetical protein